jgi:hypothetical protein
MQEVELIIFRPTKSIPAVWNDRQLREAHHLLELSAHHMLSGFQVILLNQPRLAGALAVRTAR